MSRPDRDTFWFTLAEAYARRSTCPRARIGSVLVKFDRLIGAGFNGAPEGEPHCPETPEHLALEHCQQARHSEVNALRNALLPPFGATLYVVGPRRVCERCADRLRENGVTDIRHRESMPTLESTLAEVAAWGRETFPNSTDRAKFSHLYEEVRELEAEPDRAEEAADVLMILAHIASAHGYLDRLNAEVIRKLAICRRRTWGAPDADGKIKAIKDGVVA